MTFNVESFKTNGLIYGGARPTLFEVQVNLPTALSAVATFTTYKLAFTCRAADLPPATLGVVEVPYFGRKIKVAGDRTYPNWTITVMNDEDFSARAAFEAWSNYINSFRGNLRNPAAAGEASAAQGGSNSYKSDMQVIQFAKTGEALRTYQIIEAWPVTVSPIPLDWNTTNTVETFTVDFAYDYWIPDLTNENNTAKTQGTISYSGLV